MTENKAPRAAGTLGRTIFRIVKNPDNPYVMMDKRPIENPDLTWSAKGMLSYMLSRPDDWEFNVQDLINRALDGKSAVRAAMKELRLAGHLVYAGRTGNQSGRGSRAIWHVHEVPRIRTENRHELTNSYRFSDSENRTLTNKEDTKIIDDERAAKLSLVSRMYEANIGPITALMADLIRNACIDFPEPWFKEAFEIAVKHNVRKWSYVEAILDGWKRNGFGWKPEKSKGGNGRHASPAPQALDKAELAKMRKFAEEQLVPNAGK